jgi:hypothetical protein
MKKVFIFLYQLLETWREIRLAYHSRNDNRLIGE